MWPMGLFLRGGKSECPSSNPTFPKIFLKSDREIPSHTIYLNIISIDLLLWVSAGSLLLNTRNYWANLVSLAILAYLVIKFSLSH